MCILALLNCYTLYVSATSQAYHGVTYRFTYTVPNNTDVNCGDVYANQIKSHLTVLSSAFTQRCANITGSGMDVSPAASGSVNVVLTVSLTFALISFIFVNIKSTKQYAFWEQYIYIFNNGISIYMMYILNYESVDIS